MIIRMLRQRHFELTDPADLRHVVDAHPWATLVSAGLAVSHLPVIVDPLSDELVILGHLARADAAKHQLGAVDCVLIVEGPHGYVSPTFYAGGPYVPTWNFVVVHLFGRAEPLPDGETYDVLDRTVDRLERDRPEPWRLASVVDYAHRIAGGTVAFRLTPERVVGKAKLNQDKPAADVHGVIDALADTNPALAGAMRRWVVQA